MRLATLLRTQPTLSHYQIFNHKEHKRHKRTQNRMKESPNVKAIPSFYFVPFVLFVVENLTFKIWCSEFDFAERFAKHRFVLRVVFRLQIAFFAHGLRPVTPHVNNGKRHED